MRRIKKAVVVRMERRRRVRGKWQRIRRKRRKMMMMKMKRMKRTEILNRRRIMVKMQRKVKKLNQMKKWTRKSWGKEI